MDERSEILLSREQVAEFAGLSSETLKSWSWRFNNDLPLPDHARRYCELERRIGRTVRIAEREFRAWLDRRDCPRLKSQGYVEDYRSRMIALSNDVRAAGHESLAETLAGLAGMLEVV